MRALIINDAVKASIARLEAFAQANIASWADVQSMATSALPPLGDDPRRTLVIPFGFRCVLSYEMQRAIKCRHLSVSVDQPGKMPHEQAVDEIAKLFGFTQGIHGLSVTVWTEQIGDHRAINLVEPFVP